MLTTSEIRHLHVYTHLLLAEASARGRRVKINWVDRIEASIGPSFDDPKLLIMTLPRVKTLGDADDAAMVSALIAHEIVCHGLHTDFSIPLSGGFAGALENLLEDIRGEHLGRKPFPGSNRRIHEGIKVLLKRNFFPALKDNPHPAGIITGWLLSTLRCDILGHTAMSDLRKEYEQAAVMLLGQDLYDNVLEKARSVVNVPDTSGVNNLVKEILALLKAETDDSEGDGGDSSNDESECGQDDSSDGSGDGQEQEGGNPSQAGDSKGPDSGKQGKAGANDGADESADGSEDGQDSIGGGAIKGDKAKIEKIISASLDDCGQFGQGLENQITNDSELFAPAHNEYQQAMPAEMPRVPRPMVARNNPPELKRVAAPLTSSLKMRISDLLEAKTKRKVRVSNSGSLINSKLYQVVQGNFDVFRHTHRGDEVDTCVELLIDTSDSMCEKISLTYSGDMAKQITRMDAATRVAVGLGEALRSIEVPYGISSYSDRYCDVTAPSDSWDRCLQRLKLVTDGMTHTNLAVPIAMEKLLYRKEARKLLLVVTDGDPGSADELLAAINEASSLGVEVRFVLIDPDEQWIKLYDGIKKQCGVAKTANDLAKAVFSAIEESLT